jgi:hypothetical protein
VTEIVLQRGKCTYWGCENWTQGVYCREHTPERCRVCDCLPYGSRGLTLGMCNRHYKYWARHNSPQRARILAGDRRQSAKRRAAARLKKAAEEWDRAWQPATEAERQEMGGWASGACFADPPGLFLVGGER